MYVHKSKELAYSPCGKSTTIRLPNGAYTFVTCTLLICDKTGHEGQCKFALTLYEMIRKDVVRL